MTTLITFFTSFLDAGFLPEGAFSNKAKGTTAASFLKLSASPRSAALAETLNPSQADPLAGLQMPASYLGAPDASNFALGSGFLPEGIIQANALYGHPVGSKKIVLAVHEVLQPSLGLYDVLGNKTGEFRPADMAVGLTVAGGPQPVRWGAGLSFLQSKIGPGISGQGMAANLGMNIPYGRFADPNLSFSLAAVNIGPPVKWGSRSVALPLKGQAQMGYKMGEMAFLALDVIAPVDQTAYGAASMEWKLAFNNEPLADGGDPESGLAVRVGVNSKNKTESFTGKLSFGLGLYLGGLTIDAALAPFGDLGFFPRVGLSMAF